MILATKSKKKKILCLFWHADFESHLNAGCVCLWMLVWWTSAMEAEKKVVPQIYDQKSCSSESGKSTKSWASSLSCWRAIWEMGKWRREAGPVSAFAFFRDILVSLANENNSGKCTLVTWLLQRSSQNRQVTPSRTLTLAIPLKESKSLRLSRHQKDPFFVVRVRIHCYNIIPKPSSPRNIQLVKEFMKVFQEQRFMLGLQV